MNSSPHGPLPIGDQAGSFSSPVADSVMITQLQRQTELLESLDADDDDDELELLELDDSELLELLELLELDDDDETEQQQRRGISRVRLQCETRSRS